MSWKLKTIVLPAIIVVGCVPLLYHLPEASAAEETGPAAFLRDHDAAMVAAKKSGKPVFAFFQEVPG